MIVKWNRRSFYISLLLVCGDINPNPGPDSLFPCSICGVEVLDVDKAVYCDKCDKWVHVSCDPSLSDSLYEEMIHSSVEDVWYCSICANNKDCSNESSAANNKDCPSECSTGVSGNVLSCVCLNARSILLKRFDLFAYICCHKVDILSITETFLDSSILDAEICPQTYVLFRHDHSRHGGGVLILVRDDLHVTPCYDLNTFCDELLWLEIRTSTGPDLFGVFYRPPSQSIDNLVALNNCLLSVSHYLIILCGDFNLPTINWSVTFPTVSSPTANMMCELIRDNYLYQMVVDPTRNQNLLDLVLTNQPDIVKNVQVVENLPLTDHDAIQLSLDIAIPMQSHCKRLLYNYKKVNLSILFDILSHVPWNIIETVDDVEESWQLFKDLFWSAINTCVPRLQWRRKKLKHWFSYQTIHLICKKRRLYLRMKSFVTPSSVLLLKYKRISNQVRRLTRLDTK